jgi:hypothetical protein
VTRIEISDVRVALICFICRSSDHWDSHLFSKKFTRIVVMNIEHLLVMKIALRINDLLSRKESHGLCYRGSQEFVLKALQVCVASICCAVTVAQALAQTTPESAVSTNILEPTPAPQTSPLPSPETLFRSPTPSPLVSPTPLPTPLPDGTMPQPLPVMPTPVLQDAETLAKELDQPLPGPRQFSEPLMKPGEWKFSPAIGLPSPSVAPTLSPSPTPMQSHQ